VTFEVLSLLGPTCRDPLRRGLILERVVPPIPNGIDYVEYLGAVGPDPHVLRLHFLHPVPPTGYGLVADPTLARIEGGTRIVGIRATVVRPGPASAPRTLDIVVDAQGDFSTYWLSVGWRETATGWLLTIPEIDRQFSVAPVNFRPGCLVDFDCGPHDRCPPDHLPEPVIDYLARDYGSFRQLLLDVVAQRNPDWLERNPADLGIALLELFAYEGDQLSYYQDATANEAYLDTARRRVSAKRHARLVDYRMHDGRNAWTEVHVAVSAAGSLPIRTRFVSRIDVPLRLRESPPGPVVDQVHPEDWGLDPALRDARVFETVSALRTDPTTNHIRIHAWGNGDCCLPAGTTTIHCYHVPGDGLPPGAGPVDPVAALPDIRVGDLLLIEEVVSPDTGSSDDADPDHRQVVRVERVVGATSPIVDPMFDAKLVGGVLRPFATAALPLLEVSWSRVDALRFPLCVSRPRDHETLTDLTVARGNIVLADHGRTLTETLDVAPIPEGAGLRISLDQAPLTMHIPVPVAGVPRDLGGDVRSAVPAVSLVIDGGPDPGLWEPVPDLLDSPPWARQFVADIEDGGHATLRFGDGDEGQEPAGGTRIAATYRIGSGRAGNIGAEALAHLIVDGPVPAPPNGPTVIGVRNPLPARDGTDPETIAEVRHAAPAAFRAHQYRAVTEGDYVDAATRVAGVAGAVAAFRWTGSWFTVHVGIDPADPADLITDPGGRTHLAAPFEAAVRAALTRVRLAGYDLEVRSAQYVPLHVVLDLCVLPGWFRADVTEAVLAALAPGTDRLGVVGFFDASRWTFGTPLYLSRLYAAVEAVPGVDTVVVGACHRYGRLADGELEAGVLEVGAWEIVRLDNDRSRMENGLLVVTAGGGK
jgi:hypothetical protein